MHRAAAASGTDAAPPAASTDLGWSWFDTAIVVAVAVATVLVHPIHLLLTKPFWLDEAWVAVLTKAPLRQLPRMSSTAPVGFVALLRFVPGSGLQRGRLVVLGFSVLTAITAYVLARGLRWKQRWLAQFGATVAALVVMLAPFSLVRNDLKQYTCDGFCALLLLRVRRAGRAAEEPAVVDLARGRRGRRDAVQLDGPVRRGRRVRGVARLRDDGSSVAESRRHPRDRARRGRVARRLFRGGGRAEPQLESAHLLGQLLPGGHVGPRAVSRMAPARPLVALPRDAARCVHCAVRARDRDARPVAGTRARGSRCR